MAVLARLCLNSQSSGGETHVIHPAAALVWPCVRAITSSEPGFWVMLSFKVFYLSPSTEKGISDHMDAWFLQPRTYKPGLQSCTIVNVHRATLTASNSGSQSAPSKFSCASLERITFHPIGTLSYEALWIHRLENFQGCNIRTWMNIRISILWHKFMMKVSLLKDWKSDFDLKSLHILGYSTLYHWVALVG